jgi:predicted AAA+ superfamily ATPase
MDIRKIFRPYNPWWGNSKDSFNLIPAFHRPIFDTLCEDLNKIPQILAVTGPRRIGKTTLLLQLIQRLINDGVPAANLVYYSFDDPALIARRINVDELIDRAMKLFGHTTEEGTAYLFLDEIQRLDRWELYLKKYYDLRYQVRIIISGSASSPIFKKSRESLLGRVKDYHLLPFSFREFAMFSLKDNPALLSEIEQIYEQGTAAQGMITEAPGIDVESILLKLPTDELRFSLDSLMDQYLLEGGFPEVWSLPNWIAKQEYLYDNQVKKVIYEDLILAAEFRKPELLKRFYISLLEIPGKEVAIQSVSNDTAINVKQIEKYIPLLEMTDLVYRVSKFRAGALRVRRGNMKFYLVDLALRNAALRLTDTLLKDDSVLGLYAENLVFLALRKWRGTIQMDYYRERHGEVDFIVHVGPHRFLPVEVKYRNQITAKDVIGVKRFVAKYRKSVQPFIVTKRWSDFYTKDQITYVPLALFLLLFD